MKFRGGKLLPNDAICIPIRADREVVVLNVPYDLTKAEHAKIEKILIAHANTDNNHG